METELLTQARATAAGKGVFGCCFCVTVRIMGSVGPENRNYSSTVYTSWLAYARGLHGCGSRNVPHLCEAAGLPERAAVERRRFDMVVES